jgi:hypothetical protein
MKTIAPLVLFLAFMLNFSRLSGQDLQIRGFCIAAPQPDRLEQFLKFMEEELAGNGINTLILRMDYNYEYECYPNLRGRDPLTRKQVRKLVKVARKNDLRLIPQINLLGHQSWAGNLGKLLEEYPQFDETPSVEMPEDYKWPNEDGLYCKSYCPLHPGIHEIVFALVDEITEVFETDAFHAGMDEVFYIGEDDCPRCRGKDKAELFAGEVTLIRDHLAETGKELWIWGDRLLDGKTTGLGMWEASENNTHEAIDLIPKDVVICDWHYERADPTIAYFAMKGFRVMFCSYNKPEVTRAQLELTDALREHSNNLLRERYIGFMQTVWSPAGRFLDFYYGDQENEDRMGPVNSYREMIRYIND